MNFTYECSECGNPNEFEFIPGEPVKFCMDHDHPEFSNPGSGDELNGPDVCETCQETIDKNKAMEQAAAKFHEDAGNYDGPDRNEDNCGRGVL